MNDRTDIEEDVVSVLREQHREIERLFAEIDRAFGAHRTTAWQRLATLLTAHETAEGELVHPTVRAIHGAAAVAEERVHEETRLLEMVDELQEMGADDDGFAARLHELRDETVLHHRAEEEHEFPLLRVHLGERRSRHLAGEVRRAGSMVSVGHREDRPLYVGVPADFDGTEVHLDEVVLGPFRTVAAVVREALRSEEERWTDRG